MIQEGFVPKREEKHQTITADLVVIGGGLAGTCCAISAARNGIKVALVQDRPVLGGNASSEVRLWSLGATSHMGNNNRWAMEGGIIQEILLDNLNRNKEGNPVIFDTVILDKVLAEGNIQLFLNTVVYDIDKTNDKTIKSVIAFCSQNSTHYNFEAPFFTDASGDGVVAFKAGASFRMGAETKEEFGEGFAPNVQDYGELLGHTIYFYSKDVGKPITFKAPNFALKDITKIPRFRKFNSNMTGCALWWVEYGGRLDTVHDTETIKFELWKVVYGIWDYIKNSGNFPDAETLTLEWVGTIPGKRESRRFMGDYMLTQQDVIEQRPHPDAVVHGGWAIDLHPADGIYSEMSGCTQWHSKGMYGIPWRCYYSQDIDNLFLAGRLISVSHVAFGSTRVMLTCAAGGQAVGAAAAMCVQAGLTPRSMGEAVNIKNLQQKLLYQGQHIPNVEIDQSLNLASQAEIRVSSTYELNNFPENGEWLPLEFDTAQSLPLQPGPVPTMSIKIKAEMECSITIQFRTSLEPTNHTPEKIWAEKEITLKQGVQEIALDFDLELPVACYGYYCLMANENVQVMQSDVRCTGVLSVFRKINKAVSNYGRQDPPTGIGVDSFEFWTPRRRPEGKNIAFTLSEPVKSFGKESLTSGSFRPSETSHAWLADINDPAPTVQLTWNQPIKAETLVLYFDADYDHPLESVQMGHPEEIVPFCVQSFQVFIDGKLVFEKQENYQSRLEFTMPETTFSELEIKLVQPSDQVPAAMFGVVVI